jgi:hypothetical protein
MKDKYILELFRTGENLNSFFDTIFHPFSTHRYTYIRIKSNHPLFGQSNPNIIYSYCFIMTKCLIVFSSFWIVMLLFVVPFVLIQGSLHASLVEAVRAHKMLRTSPYCKRIFSKTQFKKWCSDKTLLLFLMIILLITSSLFSMCILATICLA